MELAVLIFKVCLIVAVFAITLVAAMYSTWAERKVAAFLQDRVGPNRAGPFGLLQPLADGVKMFMKEEIIPSDSNRFLFVLGPCLAMMTAGMASAVMPWGGAITIGDDTFLLQAADINIGILYILGVTSVGIYGIMIGGWASNNKYSLLGAIRASSQMISYELAMGLSVIAVVMMTGDLSLKAIVEGQPGGHWNVFYQPLGFIIFLICAFAETNRAPFDLPECETELIGGYHTEYSSMKLGFFLFAEYINMFVSCALIASVYFGGYNMPFIRDFGWSENTITIVGTACFFLKIIFGIFFFMWVRWTLPRFRYDQLMKLGWQILIPLSIINVILTGLGIIVFK
ncbi:MAG: NADH-quinone oxidoreductase subunit NuoH [Flavobacteriales bacterium]